MLLNWIGRLTLEGNNILGFEAKLGGKRKKLFPNAGTFLAHLKTFLSSSGPQALRAIGKPGEKVHVFMWVESYSVLLVPPPYLLSHVSFKNYMTLSHSSSKCCNISKILAQKFEVTQLCDWIGLYYNTKHPKGKKNNFQCGINVLGKSLVFHFR